MTQFNNAIFLTAEGRAEELQLILRVAASAYFAGEIRGFTSCLNCNPYEEATSEERNRKIGTGTITVTGTPEQLQALSRELGGTSCWVLSHRTIPPLLGPFLEALLANRMQRAADARRPYQPGQ